MKVQIICGEVAKNKQDSFWYDGQIATLETKNYVYSLEAQGDIRVFYKDECFNDYQALEFCEDKKWTDKDLKKFEWDMNNWFEVIGINKKTNEVESVIGDVAYDYDEGITMLKTYVKERIYEKKSKPMWL